MNYRSLTRFHLKDYRRSSLILLCVLVLVDIAMAVLMKLLPSLDMGSADSIFSVNRTIITIFAFISMIITVAVTFPLMSSFSVTRRNFYISTLLALLGFCITATLAESILYLIGRVVLPSWGLVVDVDRSLVLSWYTFLVTLLELSIATFLVGSIFYRFNIIMGIFSAVVYFGLTDLLSKLLSSPDYVEESALFQLSPETAHPGSTLSVWFIIALCVTAGWLVYRRTDVRM